MRWIGAIAIVCCGGYFGFSMVVYHKSEEKALRQIITAVRYMLCEIQCRLTPLPQLLGQAAKEISGISSVVMEALGDELEGQIMPDVSCCMDTILRSHKNIPNQTREVFTVLGRCLGRFDLQGQIKELESVEQLCERYLAELENNRDSRLRSYQTLGICAGAAIAILLL